MNDVWQPIATAPLDGTVVLLRCSFTQLPADYITAKYVAIWYNIGTWQLVQAGEYAENSEVYGVPTHWASIPSFSDAADETIL